MIREDEERSQPVMVIKEKDIQLSVWPNKWGEKGKKITYYTFSLSKVTKELHGGYKYQKSFPMKDIDALKMVLDKLKERKGELGPSA
jgi:hypothetical protein